MEFNISQKSGKKRRFSFWQHLKGLTGKNKPEQVSATKDVTLLAASKLYNSFRHNAGKNAMLEVPVIETPENYVTLEDSQLQNVHRDAGILFLTSNNQLKWQSSDEHQKHVQFAPTPCNKYHTYSSDPRKMLKSSYFDKENSHLIAESSLRLPPALKHTVSMKSSYEDSEAISSSRNSRMFQEINSNVQKNVTPFLPRTSTKSTLGQNDSTLPHFNESSICQVRQHSQNPKVDSLKRPNQKHLEQHSVNEYCQKDTNIFPQLLFGSQAKDPNDVIEEYQMSNENITHYFIDGIPATSNTVLLPNLGSDSYHDFSQTLGLKGRYTKNDLKRLSNPHPSLNIEHSKDATGNVPHYAVYNLENPKTEMMNMKTSWRRHSFRQYQSQQVENNDSSISNRKNYIDLAPSMASQPPILKKAPVVEASESVGKSVPMNQHVVQAHDPLIPPFVSLPTINQRMNLRRQPTKNISKTSYRRSYDPKVLNHLQSRELPMVPENARMEDVTKYMKFSKGVRSSSPDQANSKDCRRKPKIKYDGASSMADDECSLNCSCGDCLIDPKYMPKELRRSYRREQVKARLFFPSDNYDDQPIPPGGFRTSSADTFQFASKVINKEPEEQWYTCNDIICTSPVDQHEVANVTSNIYQENIYANSGVFIADDYEIQCDVKSSSKRVTAQAENNLQISANDEATEDGNGNSTYSAIAEPSVNLHLLDGLEMTPRTKKLSQNCISALKDTLANLLQNYKDQPNPSFSISSFNSENESSEKLNTIVIKIEKEDNDAKKENDVQQEEDNSNDQQKKGDYSQQKKNDGIQQKKYDYNQQKEFHNDQQKEDNNDQQKKDDNDQRKESHNNQQKESHNNQQKESHNNQQKESHNNQQKESHNNQQKKDDNDQQKKDDNDQRKKDDNDQQKKDDNDQQKKDDNDQQKKKDEQTTLPINTLEFSDWNLSSHHKGTRKRRSLSLCQSLPDLFNDDKHHKEAKDVVFGSTMVLSPRTKNSAKAYETQATNGLNMAKNSTTESIEHNEEFPSGWDKSPSPEDTNSGYSTCSLASSLKDSTVSLSTRDRELLKDLIKAGMGTQTPASKKKVLSTPKFFKVGKYKAKEVLSGKAKLKLSIYYNAGLVTVYIMKAMKLTSVRTLQLNTYVKVSLHPDDSKRVHWRSKVVNEQNNPVFNQKFSFEISPGDSTKRLIFSVWHRDLEKKRSEFLGCMSFGVHRVLDSNQQLRGWYRLLKEVVGTKKHFAAGNGKGNAVIKI